MKYVVAFVAGALFSVGLVISGMTQPSKVIGFLDFFGQWDPSLAFVMGGAVLVNAVVYRFAMTRDRPVFEADFNLPVRTSIDARLIGGGVLFGVGWGLAGYCPGPAVTSLVSGTTALTFVASMMAGIYLYGLIEERLDASRRETNASLHGGRAGQRIEIPSAE